jgi:hypothetical protein
MIGWDSCTLLYRGSRPTGAGQDIRLFECGKVYMAYGVGRALFGTAPAYATGSP